MMVEKHCVFCGVKPKDKTKEHVVPHWLIELTGKKNRKACFGFSMDLQNFKLQERSFGFDKFTFPACSKCNQKYSDLEARAKKHICNVLDGNKLTVIDVSDLLDWFDKVRVGTWLGMRQLDKNKAKVDPTFHIESRLGQFDRMLIIEKSDMLEQRLNFGGTETLCFALTPGAFLLIINGYYFTNVSGMFLCSRRLGFPFIKKSRLNPDREQVEIVLGEGRERIMKPILRKKISEKGARFFQPMFKGGLIVGEADVYNSDYVQAHSIDDHLGIGNIFEESISGIKEYNKCDIISLEPTIIQDECKLHVLSVINILEWQLWLHSDLPDMTLLSPDQRKYIQHRLGNANRVNLLFVDYYRKMLKQYA